jgi:GR25 family glycosyltransferase involved in LPS biosynthesis
VHVINLDRQPDRWRLIRRELSALKDPSGQPLIAITRRFSAVDARYLDGRPSAALIQPFYSLADQLFVQPDPLLMNDLKVAGRRIEMTSQEVAVALSHIEVWKLIASDDRLYTLVLEDDVYFRRNFAHALDRVWPELMAHARGEAAFDILYLSYTAVGSERTRTPVSAEVFRPTTGLWQLSGYVLSQRGAQKLLRSLPIRGPVDLWLNHQFKSLEVLATNTPLIKQRLDFASGNSYSVLPVLSQVGVLRRERPSLPRRIVRPRPIFAFGERGSGLTALAMALSMLGYRCCSDIAELPKAEHDRLFGKHTTRVFDAYVNIGWLSPSDYLELMGRYREARVIFTVRGADGSGPAIRWSRGAPNELDDSMGPGCCSPTDILSRFDSRTRQRVLVLPVEHRDKWELLRSFLGCDYPSHRYPQCQDRPQRGVIGHRNGPRFRAQRLTSDVSPWVIARPNWHGLPTVPAERANGELSRRGTVIDRFDGVEDAMWMLRDDTFPSNLAVFRPSNCSVADDDSARLTLRQEHTAVRDFTSAAIASRNRYLYGRFVAELRPSAVSGLITGMFLHRNAPRQEIDVEILGRDATKMLVNVYYNPGNDGAKLEYGYRGAPALIDLEFDADQDFHKYEIDWRADFIRWYVDGRLVYERVDWDPTPIPHLPMQFNVNLWHAKSRDLAGKLDEGKLPAQSAVRHIELMAESRLPANITSDFVVDCAGLDLGRAT